MSQSLDFDHVDSHFTKAADDLDGQIGEFVQYARSLGIQITRAQLAVEVRDDGELSINHQEPFEWLENMTDPEYGN